MSLNSCATWSYLGHFPVPKLYQPLRIWWVLITNSALKNEATGGGSFLFSPFVFNLSGYCVFLWALLVAVLVPSCQHKEQPWGKSGIFAYPIWDFAANFENFKALNGCLQNTQDCKPLPINKAWKCSHCILSFKFRLSLWSMDLQKCEGTQRFAAEGIQQMLFLEEGFCSCALFCSCLLLLTWQTQFMPSSFWLKTCQSSFLLNGKAWWNKSNK